MVIDDAPRGSTDDTARQFPDVMVHKERAIPGVFASANGTLSTQDVQKRVGVLMGAKFVC